MTIDTTNESDNSPDHSPGILASARSFSLSASKMVPITDDYNSDDVVFIEDNELVYEKPRMDPLRVRQLMDTWRKAARRARTNYVDPWDEFNIHEYPVQRAKRYRYSAIRKQWTEDIVDVRIHPDSFARGAMRECYRLKKCSVHGATRDWSSNYVAKRYICQVDRRVLFDDVRLQMDAKLWAEEFNRYNPPKKIDIVQMCVIELIDVKDSPLYHLEHFIEGKYIKYNSNSGFVSNAARLTPQAFSHFTFERSGHQMMVVDIQGVGDLYTDPQIHTVVGTDYGDGNLGTRGMALFFHSHRCNDICETMDLSNFELSPPEIEATEHAIAIAAQQKKSCVAAPTVFEARRNRISSECIHVVEHGISMDQLRKRQTLNQSSTDVSVKVHNEDCVCPECIPVVEQLCEPCSDDEEDEDEEEDYPRSEKSGNSSKSRRSRMSISTRSSCDEERPRKCGFVDLASLRQRHDSFRSSVGTYSMNSSRQTRETEKDEFWKVLRKQSVPANILSLQLQQLAQQNADLQDEDSVPQVTGHQYSILGQIHIDLARYHELGRFIEVDSEHKEMLDGSENDARAPIKYDKQSAIFHLDIARKCGILEAVLTSAHIVLGLPHELLKEVTVEDLFPNGLEEQENGINDLEEFGSDLMEIAAEMGDKGAMLYMAHAYETGQRLGPNRSTDYQKSIEWYQRVVGFQDEEPDTDTGKSAFSSFSPLSRHEILAKMAEMYKEGGYGLNRDFERAYCLFNEAAEAAMEAMNGKLANKYYEKAEMCGE